MSKGAENFGIGVKFYSEDDGGGVNSNKARKGSSFGKNGLKALLFQYTPI
jgi:hypothetical protein